jgi:hypothetical protein
MDVQAETIKTNIREFVQNAREGGYAEEVDKMTDRELAEDLWLKAGVEVEWTIEQIQTAVREIRREVTTK